MDGLLHAGSAAVQGVAGEPDDVERVHDRDRVREFLDGGSLEAGEPIHRDHLHPIAPDLGRSASQALNARLERPPTMSSSLAGPVPSRIPARPITVTYLSPRRVWRHTCSSTPIAATPSTRCSSSIGTRLPSARNVERPQV